jgi:sugar phosphate isomerase/epimerase
MKMKNQLSRRKFLRSIAAAPLMASFPSVLASDTSSVSKEHGHKFKLSLNAYSFNSLLRDGAMDLFDLLEFCAAHNFDAIDPTGYYFPGYPEVPSDSYINAFKRKAFLLGLDISGTGVRNNFTHPDEEIRAADKALIKEWIQVAAKLGSPNLRVFAGKDDHPGYSRDQAFEWVASGLKECCEVGKQYGVMVALQNHNNFIKTAADVDRIFSMVDSEWFGLNLDIGSYRQGDPYAEIEKNIHLAVTWQIKENVWIDGEATPTDYVRLLRLMKKAGYRGYLPIETLGPGDPHEKVPVLLANVRQALDALND